MKPRHSILTVVVLAVAAGCPTGIAGSTGAEPEADQAGRPVQVLCKREGASPPA